MKSNLGIAGLLAFSLAVGLLVSVSAARAPETSANAQIGPGSFWCFQPHIPTPVGFAYCNATHTVEYWAYVVDEYEYSSMDNGPSNRWHLDAQAAPMPAPQGFAGFKEQVLAKPEFQGKTLRFANHSILEETIVN